jgi:hypothetical protein
MSISACEDVMVARAADSTGYDGSRLRNRADISNIGPDKAPVVRKRERVIGGVVERHVVVAGSEIHALSSSAAIENVDG